MDDLWSGPAKTREDIHVEAQDAATEEYIACLFLRNADRKRCGHVADRLADDYVLAAGEPAKRETFYSKTRAAMKRLMADYGKEKQQKEAVATGEGVAFAQNDMEQKAKDKKCHACGKVHPGGWRHCRTTIFERKAEIKAEIKRKKAAAAANGAKKDTLAGGNARAKRGTAHANVKGDNDASAASSHQSDHGSRSAAADVAAAVKLCRKAGTLSFNAGGASPSD